VNTQIALGRPRREWSFPPPPRPRAAKRSRGRGSGRRPLVRGSSHLLDCSPDPTGVSGNDARLFPPLCVSAPLRFVFSSTSPRLRGEVRPQAGARGSSHLLYCSPDPTDVPPIKPAFAFLIPSPCPLFPSFFSSNFPLATRHSSPLRASAVFFPLIHSPLTTIRHTFSEYHSELRSLPVVVWQDAATTSAVLTTLI